MTISAKTMYDYSVAIEGYNAMARKTHLDKPNPLLKRPRKLRPSKKRAAASVKKTNDFNGKSWPSTSSEAEEGLLWKARKLDDFNRKIWERPPPQSVKEDAHKTRLDLLDPFFLSSTAAVLTAGAEKYGAYNWAQGTFSWSRLYGALLRHLNAFWEGEERDPEWGLSHLSHAACCLMFLMRYEKDRLGRDDRHPYGKVRAERATKTGLE